MTLTSIGLDFYPLGLNLDYPYAYVCGFGSGNATGVIEKYDVSQWPFKKLDSHVYFTSLYSTPYAYIFNCRSGVGAYSGYLLAPGTYRDVTGKYHIILLMIDKTNLSNISWTYDATGGSTSAYYMQDAMMDPGTDTEQYDIYACGYGSPSGGVNASVWRLDVAGNLKQKNEVAYYSTLQSILGFYSSGGSHYVDIAGSNGGIPKKIFRIVKSTLAEMTVTIPYEYYTYYGGCQNTEGGIVYYYVGANVWSDGNPFYWEESLSKITQSSHATVWEQFINTRPDPNISAENLYGCSADETYIYGLGEYFSASTVNQSLDPVTPLFSCYDLSGVQQWSITGDAGKKPYMNCIQQVSSQSYFFDVLSNRTYGGSYLGFLEMRKKSDGTLADSSVFPQSFLWPVCYP